LRLYAGGTGEGLVTVTSQIVKYKVDESTEAAFVIDPDEWVGWQDVGKRPADVVCAVRDAVGPAVEAAKVVLDKIRDIKPDAVEVKFGISVSGGVNWAIAKAAAEGSFEVTLSWSPDIGQPASLPEPAGQPASLPEPAGQPAKA
jgi:Trypsin-co-occurring domain 1